MEREWVMQLRSACFLDLEKCKSYYIRLLTVKKIYTVLLVEQ
jgi:hypothetical protein